MLLMRAVAFVFDPWVGPPQRFGRVLQRKHLIFPRGIQNLGSGGVMSKYTLMLNLPGKIVPVNSTGATRHD